MRLGVDIGGTKLNVGIFTDSGQIVANRKGLLREITSLPDFIAETADLLCAENKIARGELSCCGVGVPGTVSEDGTHIIKVPNLNLDVDFEETLAGRLGLPCRFLQDSRAAALGEYLCGAGIGTKTLICVTLGTGIGTGIIIDGKIYHGALGCAGELGHIPVADSDADDSARLCGCGKTGCLEKYAAGGGLDITARELLGGEADARDLIAAAFDQNTNDELRKSARDAIGEAIETLGRAMVGAINLLSPDMLLFSGGLAESARFVDPLVGFIKSHCYFAGRLPVIKKASLGENSPLYGAAMYAAQHVEPHETQHASAQHAPSDHASACCKPMLAASVMCADFLNLGRSLTELESAGIDYIHCDIMDNHFVPNLMLPPEFCTKIRAGTSLPFDYHIMCEHPETVVEKLDLREGDFVSIHYESTNHLQRVISLVKSRGARAGVAINPATPIEMISEILPDIEMVLIMSVNPGFAGQKLVASSLGKLARLREMLAREGRSNVIVEVDGNCSFENLPKMRKAGADMFVVGTSSLFSKGMSVAEAAVKIAEIL